MQLDLNENPNKYNGGTFFVIFDNMLMKDKFIEFFPRSNFNKIIWRYMFCSVKRKARYAYTY